MGFRLTFYAGSTKFAEEVKNFTNEDIAEYDRFSDLKEKYLEEIISDCTNWMYRKTSINTSVANAELWSRVFESRLEIEDDIMYMKMGKDQFLHFIYHIRDIVIYNNHLDLLENNDLTAVKDIDDGDIYKIDTLRSKKYLDNNDFHVSALTVLHRTQVKANHRARMDDIDLSDSSMPNIMENKYIVGPTDSYRDLLFSLIHIYKILNWDEDMIYIIGG